MTQQLPNELKIQIIRHVDRKSLPTVLRVSSTFHGIGVPILYHTIILRPFPHRSQPQWLGIAAKCLNTIIERPAAAGAVHSMGLDLMSAGHYNYVYDAEPDIGAKFFEALRIALPKLVNLQKLEIANWNLLGTNSLPHLPRGYRFPTLQHYSGPPEILDDIQSNALRTLLIREVVDISTVSITLLAAARLGGQTLRTLNIQSYRDLGDEGWERLRTNIPSLFPNLRHLALNTVHIVSFAYLDKLIPIIRRLPNLRLLRIAGYDGLLEEESKIKHLHAGCPQLRAIAVYDEPWRYSEPGRTWLRPPNFGEPHSDSQLWEEADYHKYFEDPYHEGFVYHSVING
ncbi:hypothetical protein FRC00_007942 [Tulasnella sp. 408]|nr:hypothetical protein FRC00_007942 [Tulasnella sp. 408]